MGNDFCSASLVPLVREEFMNTQYRLLAILPRCRIQTPSGDPLSIMSQDVPQGLIPAEASVHTRKEPEGSVIVEW